MFRNFGTPSSARKNGSRTVALRTAEIKLRSMPTMSMVSRPVTVMFEYCYAAAIMFCS